MYLCIIFLHPHQQFTLSQLALQETEPPYSDTRDQKGLLPAVDNDGPFGPVHLLPDNLHELQDVLDGIDRGDSMIWPRRVVQVQHILALISLRNGFGLLESSLNGKNCDNLYININYSIRYGSNTNINSGLSKFL